MVLGQQRALHLEQVLGIAQVRLQFGGDVGLRLHRAGEDLHPRLQHRVGLVLRIQSHRAVVGVHGGLHRVADVGHLLVGGQPVERHLVGVGGDTRQRRQLRIRVVVQRRVTVDDPHHPLVDDGGVHAGVGGQPRCHRLHPLGRVAIEQDPALRPDRAGEHQLSLGELRGKHGAVQPVADRNATLAAVGVVLGLGVGFVVVLAVGAALADDGVVGGGARDDGPEVHPRLVQRRGSRRGDAAVGADDAGKELRIPAVLVGVVGDATNGVGRRRDEAVAVGVDEVAVDPVALVVDQAVGVELTGGDDVVTEVTVGTVVPVDGQLVGEVVEVLALLELRERGADDRRVEQPDVRRRRAVGGHLLSRGGCIARIVTVGHRFVGQPVGVARRGDTSADVVAFLLRRIGFDGDLLDYQRPPCTDDHRRQQQKHHTDRGNSQVAQHNRRENRHRADHRDGHQDQLGRQHRIDVGITGTGERFTAAGIRQQRVAVEPVGDRLEKHKGADQADQLDTRGTAQRAGSARQPDTAEQVVAQQIRDQRQERGDEQIADHQAVERQIERIEAQIQTELRILDTEFAAVQEQLNPLPIRLGDDAREEADDRGYADAHQLQSRHHRGAVAGDGVVGPGCRDEHRPRPVRQRQRHEYDGTDQYPHHEEHDELGQHLCGEHRPVAELAVPEPVDIGVDEARPHKQQQYDRDGDRDQNSAPSRQLRHLGRRPHTHSSTPGFRPCTS